jgi:4,5-dihydroxyphthalate decarboxylase
VFRRAYVYLHAGSGIQRPEDLAGKSVGVPEYHMTAALFIRGFLADDHGVKAEQIEWVQGGQEVPGRLERIELDLPSSIRLRHEPDRSLDEMLVDGSIDALVTASPPPSWLAGNPAVIRLFDDPRAAELDAYRRTGIFPIMHLVTVRRDVVERWPWVPGNLVTAFAEARDLAYEESRDHGASSNILPFYPIEHERTVREFGEDYWPYGVDANRATLEAAVRYSYEQGLSRRLCDIEDLFIPALLEEHRV